MDHFKQQKNNENNKIKEKRTNLNDLNTPKNAVLKSHIRPHSSEIDIDLNNFGN